MHPKKHYVPPRVVRHAKDRVPECAKSAVNELRGELEARRQVRPAYTTVVDRDRRYVEVSNSFCELLGYKPEELIGHRYDEVTAPATSDIPTVYGQFTALGRLHGLWMLRDRAGTRILVRYEAWARSDSYIESNMELVVSLETANGNPSELLIHL